jgi:hypothetical protein
MLGSLLPARLSLAASIFRTYEIRCHCKLRSVSLICLSVTTTSMSLGASKPATNGRFKTSRCVSVQLRPFDQGLHAIFADLIPSILTDQRTGSSNHLVFPGRCLLFRQSVLFSLIVPSHFSPEEPVGALAGFELPPFCFDPVGALAGFDSGSASSDPVGALAGFGSGASRIVQINPKSPSRLLVTGSQRSLSDRCSGHPTSLWRLWFLRIAPNQ